MKKIINNFKNWSDLNESVFPSLEKLFTKKMTTKLSTVGRSALEQLFGLIIKNKINFIKSEDGALLLKSSTGVTVPVSQLEKGLSALIDGKVTRDEFIKMVPAKLADGTPFSELTINVIKGSSV